MGLSCKNDGIIRVRGTLQVITGAILSKKTHCISLRRYGKYILLSHLIIRVIILVFTIPISPISIVYHNFMHI